MQARCHARRKKDGAFFHASTNDNLSVFDELGVQVIAVNEDPLEAHRPFDAKHPFPFPLASDLDRKVCNEYDCLVEVVRELQTHR